MVPTLRTLWIFTNVFATSPKDWPGYDLIKHGSDCLVRVRRETEMISHLSQVFDRFRACGFLTSVVLMSIVFCSCSYFWANFRVSGIFRFHVYTSKQIQSLFLQSYKFEIVHKKTLFWHVTNRKRHWCWQWWLWCYIDESCYTNVRRTEHRPMFDAQWIRCCRIALLWLCCYLSKLALCQTTTNVRIWSRG